MGDCSKCKTGPLGVPGLAVLTLLEVRHEDLVHQAQAHMWSDLRLARTTLVSDLRLAQRILVSELRLAYMIVLCDLRLAHTNVLTGLGLACMVDWNT